MPISFFDARRYYGSALPSDQPEGLQWATEAQRLSRPIGGQVANVLGFGAVLGGIAAVGYLPAGKGLTGWDRYVRFLRGVEEYSPAKIFRTFQLSHIFGPFGSAARSAVLPIGPELLAGNQQLTAYLSELIGIRRGESTVQRLVQEGVTFKGGRLYWGQVAPTTEWGPFRSWLFQQDIARTKPWRSSSISPMAWASQQRAAFAQPPQEALKYAAAIRAPEHGGVSHIGAAYARRLGVKQLTSQPFERFFITPEPFAGVFNPLIEGEATQIIGGRSFFQHQWRKTAALGTEQIQRFNRLLELFPKVGKYLSVKQAGGLEMLGRLSLKYGVGLGALALGYETLDWYARKSETLDETIFSEGLTYGAATVGVRSHIAAAEAAKSLGLQDYARRQEEIAPGSTDLLKLAAFPVMGAFGVSTAMYGGKIVNMARQQISEEVSSAFARHRAEETFKTWDRFGTFIDNIGRQLTTKQGLYAREGWIGRGMRALARPDREGELIYKMIGKLTPGKFGMILGAGVGLATIAPFIPGALIPSTDPEELRRIYSGQQDVPIRKGRWWEMGRSPFEGCLVPDSFLVLSNGLVKKVQDIEVDNELIDAGGCVTKVVALEKREAERECIYCPITSFDQEGLVKLTGNHQVLVVRHSGAFHKFEKPIFREWRRIDDVLLNAYYRLFVPYFAPSQELLSINIEEITKYTYIDGYWFTPVQSMWTKEMDKDVWSWGGFPRRSKERADFLDHMKEKYLVSYNQIKYRLGDLKKQAKKPNRYGRLMNIGHFIEPNLLLNKDFGRFCGYYAAEGCVNIGSVTFAFNKNEDRYINDVLKLGKDIFGLDGKTTYTSKKGVAVVFNSRILSQVMSYLVPGTASAHDKRVHDVVLNSNGEFVLGFLDGLIKGDGSVRRQSAVRLGMCPCPLLKQTQLLLSRFRVFSALGKRIFTKEGYWTQELRIPQAATFDLNKLIEIKDLPLNSVEKFQRVYGFCKLEDGFAVTIFDIKSEEYSGIVYDFEVENGESFLGPGFLMHNSRIQYYRPHAYALMGTRAREKAIWGEEYETLNPIERWFKEQFTYELEAKHFRDRPYPVTGLPFQDVPFVGPILSQTIGRWIKPELYMHIDEWLSEKGIKIPGPGWGQRIATELGETPEGIPVKPYGITQVLGEEIYRLGTELPGLTGFTTSAIKEKLTGSQDWFDQLSQLEDAGRISSYEREYWEKDLGGLAGLTEAYRRLFPHRRRQIDLVNPIRNLLPDWLPGSGEKGPNLLYGDPYATIPYGETRLPGPGYQERFPELKDVEPADYPLIHQFRILADVAPYTDQYKQALQKVRGKRARGDWSDYEENIFQTTLSQVKSMKQRKEFADYKYLSSMGELIPGAKKESSDLIVALNRYKASQGEKPSLFGKLFGGYWELLSHNAETAWDQLTPISPGGKLVHVRSPIESYERDILYGTESAFWSRPVENFLKPFGRLMARAWGYSGTPSGVEHMRNVESYFDILKYVKFSRLSNIARAARDETAVKEFEKNKNETLFGINPYTRNYGSLYRALPRRERDYLQAFEQADTIEERARILEMVPENEKDLYIARWKLVHADELKKAIKVGILTEDQEEEADRHIKRIYEDASTEGFPTSKDLMAEYLATKLEGENYADWYRRVKILGNVEYLPGPDWVGFSPSVDLEDIKLKLVHAMDEEPIPYNLWPSREKRLPYKPFIDEEAIAPLLGREKLSREEMRERVNDLLFVDKMKGEVFITQNHEQDDQIEIDAEVDQTQRYVEIMNEVL